MSTDDRVIRTQTRERIAASLSLSGFRICGVLPEDVVLARVFRLADLPSYDHSLENMASELYHHRVLRKDWDDDWVWRDSRLDLMSCVDKQFLDLLQTIVAEDVQPDEESRRALVEAINPVLVADGWSLSLVQEGTGARYVALPVGHDHAATLEGARVVAGKLGAYVSSQIKRMESGLSSDPELAIGTAKEFIETICRTILADRKTEVPFVSLPRLVQLAVRSLPIVPAEAANRLGNAERVERVLVALASIGQGLAELRNPFGTGHGKAADHVGLDLRHAALAVRSATAVGVFLFEIHDDDLRYPRDPSATA